MAVFIKEIHGFHYILVMASRADSTNVTAVPSTFPYFLTFLAESLPQSGRGWPGSVVSADYATTPLDKWPLSRGGWTNLFSGLLRFLRNTLRRAGHFRLLQPH
jgi:hypothetical protein